MFCVGLANALLMSCEAATCATGMPQWPAASSDSINGLAGARQQVPDLRAGGAASHVVRTHALPSVLSEVQGLANHLLVLRARSPVDLRRGRHPYW